MGFVFVCVYVCTHITLSSFNEHVTVYSRILHMCEDRIVLLSSKYMHGGGFILGGEKEARYSCSFFYREIKENDCRVAFWRGIAFPSLYT